MRKDNIMQVRRRTRASRKVAFSAILQFDFDRIRKLVELSVYAVCPNPCASLG
jgi:hypothetical protein